jgi:hypothetical protein
MRQFELMEKLEKRGTDFSPVIKPSLMDSTIKAPFADDYLKKSLLLSRGTSRAGSPGHTSRKNLKMTFASLLKADKEYLFPCAKCRASISIYDPSCVSCSAPNKHYEEKKGKDMGADDWRCNICATINTLPRFSCRGKRFSLHNLRLFC